MPVSPAPGEPLPPLTLGTAGHIDHGKTALIRALTGIDTDRLPEERARGISIELGYAQLELPSGRRLSVVDVPGHERFVRTMVAGASGIDLYLMVIAADDGVMPQTREHALVLRALGVHTGVVAVTKSDLADPELALLEAAELFPDAPAVAVSARTGEGLDALRAALERTAATLPGRSAATLPGRSAATLPGRSAATLPGRSAPTPPGTAPTPPGHSAAPTPSRSAAALPVRGPGPTRLHIDRVFTIRGAGTVVTGTLWAGEIGRGDELVLLPAGRPVRVRGVQVHDRPRERAAAGQRVAVNLVGVAVAEVRRGDVLAAEDPDLRPTYLIDAELTLLEREPEPGERVQVHHGTREAPARLAWLGGDFWQLRLERPLIAIAGDRLVIRQIAPPATLGGGRVLDAHPRKHGPSRALLTRLQRLAAGEAGALAAGEAGGLAAGEAGGPAAGEAAEATGVEVGEAARSTAGGSRGSPPPGASPPAPPALSPSALALEQRLREAGHEPPLDAELDPDDLRALRQAGRAIRVSPTLHYHADVLADIRRRVIELAERHGGALTLAQLRDELRTSRKFAQALLEHFDSDKLTLRRGDQHVLRRSARNQHVLRPGGGER